MAKKRVLLVNREFQFRYTLVAVLVGIISTCLSCVVILYPLYQFEILRIPAFLPTPILGVMVLAVAVNILFIWLIGIAVTHKLAGPMYSMARTLRRIEEGVWTGHLTIRKDDEMHYLVRSLNGMIDSITDACKSDLSAVRQLKKLINSLPASEDEAETLRIILEKLENSYEQRLLVDR